MDKLSKATYSDFVDFMVKNNPEISKHNYSACWNGSRYLRDLSGIDSSIDNVDSFPYEIRSDILENKKKLTSYLTYLFSVPGIYHFYQENISEIHYFTILIDDKEPKKLKLMQTYGGLDLLTVKDFDKKKWIEGYVKSGVDNDLEAYKYVFDIPEYHFKKLHIYDVRLMTCVYTIKN